MPTEKTLLKQRSQSNKLFCFIAAVTIATFAVLFIPSAYNNELFWFGGLSALTYVAMRHGYGIRSKISESSNTSAERTFGLTHPHATFMSYIPFKYITAVELCEYSLWKKSPIPSAYADSLYHYVHNHAGYQGLGLIIAYRLPTHMCAESIIRSWQFPAPKAKQFKAILDEHLNQHKKQTKPYK